MDIWEKAEGQESKGGGRREKDGPSYASSPPPKKIVGTQILLVQLNGVLAPLCKATPF